MIYGTAQADDSTAQILAADDADFRKTHGPNAKFEGRPGMDTGDAGRGAIVRRRTGQDGSLELAAYVKMPGGWAVIRECVGKSKLENLEAFRFVVKSVSYVPADSFQRPEIIEIGPVTP